jgi:3-hydroxyisobutyrate dehydrogenase-like beta-hydroxyacid dehydrogenase
MLFTSFIAWPEPGGPQRVTSLAKNSSIGRTREAAKAGTLLAMVGASDSVFGRVKPLLAHMASDIVHCGRAGTGQAMKVINNMVLFENVVALAEAMALVRHAGVEPARAFAILSKGSADSFALRNHGMKAILPGQFPERAFSSEYALKDIRYALRLGEEAGLFLTGADNAKELIKRAIRAGFAKEYFPALAKVIAPEKAPPPAAGRPATPPPAKPAARKKEKG